MNRQRITRYTHSDGGASQPDGNINGSDNDAQQTKQSRCNGVLGRLNALAAFQLAGGALGCIGGHGGGGSKESEGGKDNDELELHDCW